MMTLRCEWLLFFLCVCQGLRPSVRQVWHHGGGLPGQLHVSGADHLQLQSAGMRLRGEHGVLLILRVNTFLDFGQNFGLQGPFLPDETIDFGVMNGFVLNGLSSFEKKRQLGKTNRRFPTSWENPTSFQRELMLNHIVNIFHPIDFSAAAVSHNEKSTSDRWFSPVFTTSC